MADRIVYVLIQEIEYEPSNLQGVYSNAKDAEDARRGIAVDFGGLESLTIYAMPLDGPPLGVGRYPRQHIPINHNPKNEGSN